MSMTHQRLISIKRHGVHRAFVELYSAKGRVVLEVAAHNLQFQPYTSKFGRGDAILSMAIDSDGVHIKLVNGTACEIKSTADIFDLRYRVVPNENVLHGRLPQ